MTDLDTAHKVCTPKELAAYELAYRHMSERNIALALHISRSSVRSRLENANRKIKDNYRKDAA